MADEAEAGSVSQARTPADFLKNIKGKSVIVKLNSGVDYRGAVPQGPQSAIWARRQLAPPWAANEHTRACLPAGILACLDGYMNIAMEQTEVGAQGGAPGAAAGQTLPPPPLLAVCRPPPPLPCQRRLPLTATPRPPARRCRAQEYVNGQLKHKYGDCFIRGNNVLYISTVKES